MATRRKLRGPTDPELRAAWRELQSLGSVGPASADDLLLLGIRSVADLEGRDPNVLFAELCERTGTRQDPCVEDVLRCAVAQADHPDLPPEFRRWHLWTPLRGQPRGSLPEAFDG
ncbi:MAG: hypothetical protein O2865_05130 [Planctomycetota bacterium]|nr:hypothetical protein [Planctomycetota bacterium]MDA0932014.1 hypothetical protein [Planctomycetota bacterium]MDA1220427.1 hypothetical protein [Planctomycetota bacterium]